MKNYIDELFYSLGDTPYPKSSYTREKIALAEKINKRLDEEGKKLFHDYDDIDGICRTDSCLSHFRHGYHLGFRHVFELLMSD